MGLSVLVPEDAAQLQFKIAWGDYAPDGGDVDGFAEEADDEDGEIGERGKRNWRRSPRHAEIVVGLRESAEPHRYEVPGSDGFGIFVSVRRTGSLDLVPAGTRSVSVFLVNHRIPAPDLTRDAAYVFQPEMSLQALHPFVARPNPRGYDSDDWDEKLADLHYHDVYEYAVGHNVSASAATDANGRCREVRTAWMPSADVEKVIPTKIKGVELDMEALAAAESAEAVRAMVGPMVSEYAAWIARQGVADPADGKRAQVARDLMTNAGRAKDRIQAGLNALDDAEALAAFRLTNRAIATAIRRRACHGRPDQRPGELDPPV